MNGYFSFLHKMLEKHLWNSFLLFLVVEILQLVHEVSSFSLVLYERGVLKNFSKFTEKRKKQSYRSALSKDVPKNFVKFTETHLCRNLFLNKVAGCKPETVRSSRWRWSLKQCVRENFAIFTGKNLWRNFFLIKFEFWGPATLLKKTPTQVLSCEICKLFKNNYFEEHLMTSASKFYL